MNLGQWLFPSYDQRLTLSLAGVVQAAIMVQQLANRGYCDDQHLRFCITSLINTSPHSDDELFGDRLGLTDGLKELAKLDESDQSDKETLKYTIQILHLQKLLSKKQSMQSKIFEGLTHAERQLSMYGADNDNLIRNLADLYQNTISTLGFRIHIQGKPLYLQQDNIAARVRVVLFAAVRFAFLWRQSGGQVHHLLFSKSTISKQAKLLIKTP